MTELRVDADRLRADLASLAEIGRVLSGGITRTAYSEADGRARQWYQDRCDAAGLQVTRDGLGNTFAELIRDGVTGPAVWSGSHIDTVPDGGPLDGALGTVAALECVRRIAESGLELVRPVRAVIFSDEEGNYSGRLLGSYGLLHDYTEDELAAMTGRDGDRLVDTLASWPWASGSATETRQPPGVAHSFVELHIEQGPYLEAEGLDIGVVSAIVALGGARVELRGQADHAGTTPMDRRRDSLRAAADLVGQLYDIAAAASPSAVVTCGRLEVEPGGANVVSGLVRLTLDFREQRREVVDALAVTLEAAVRRTAERHGVEPSWSAQPVMDAVPMADEIREVIASVTDELGHSRRDIPSGAGHDSQNMAQLVPTGMIFVPSHDGRSHAPAEHTDFDAIEKGANVLLGTLIRLATTP